MYQNPTSQIPFPTAPAFYANQGMNNFFSPVVTPKFEIVPSVFSPSPVNNKNLSFQSPIPVNVTMVPNNPLSTIPTSRSQPTFPQSSPVPSFPIGSPTQITSPGNSGYPMFSPVSQYSDHREPEQNRHLSGPASFLPPQPIAPVNKTPKQVGRPKLNLTPEEILARQEKLNQQKLEYYYKNRENILKDQRERLAKDRTLLKEYKQKLKQEQGS